MSRIISFSADNDFTDGFESLIAKSGYTNRSSFLRDATMFFSQKFSRGGDLMNMQGDLIVEGHLIVHYQEKSEQKLMVSRTDTIEVVTYHHSSRLGHSCHSCVDVVHVKGMLKVLEKSMNNFRILPMSIRYLSLVLMMKDEDCC